MKRLNVSQGGLYEKGGRSLLEWENSDLNLSELKQKLAIAIEGNEGQFLIDLIKKEIAKRHL
jgi:hypothetical protein